MTTATTAVSEVNYTPEMIEAIKAAAPLNLEKAKAVGIAIGKSWRSVVAKAKSENIEYVPMPAPAKKAKGETKSEVVSDISVMTGLSFSGLAKSPASELVALRSFLSAVIPVVTGDEIPSES